MDETQHRSVLSTETRLRTDRQARPAFGAILRGYVAVVVERRIPCRRLRFLNQSVLTWPESIGARYTLMPCECDERHAFIRVKQLPSGYIATQRFAGMLFDNPLKMVIEGEGGAQKIHRNLINGIIVTFVIEL